MPNSCAQGFDGGYVVKRTGGWLAVPGMGATAVCALTVAALLSAVLPPGTWSVDLPGLRPFELGASKVRGVPPLDPSLAGLDPPGRPAPSSERPLDRSRLGESTSDIEDVTADWFEHRTEAGANDELSDATVVSRMPFRDRTDASSATRTEGDPPRRSECGPSDRNVWYRFDAPGDLLLWVDTSRSSFDTSLIVYEGSSAESLRFVKCNDNAPGLRTDSRVAIITKPKRTYFVEVLGPVEGPGSVAPAAAGSLIVHFSTGPAPSDRMRAARRIDSLPFSERTTNEEAGTEPGEAGQCSADGVPVGLGHTLWFSYDPRRTSIVVASTEMSEPSVDTVVALYQVRDDKLEFRGCNDDGKNSTSRLFMKLERGSRYLFQVGSSRTGTPGELVFTMDEAPMAANDGFAAAEPVSKVPIHVEASTVDASVERAEPLACARAGTLWYRLRLPYQAAVWVTATSADVDPAIGVFAGTSLRDLRMIDCATRGAGSSTWRVVDPPMVTFRTRPNVDYFVQVGNRSGAIGRLSIEFRLADPPLNDTRHGALRLGIAGGERLSGVRESTMWATTDPAEPVPSCGPVTATLWFRIPAQEGPVAVGAFPDAGQPQNTGLGLSIAAYRETGSGLVEAACLAGAAGRGVSIAPAGVGDFFVQVGGLMTAGVATRGTICVAIYQEHISAQRAAESCAKSGIQPEVTRRSPPALAAPYTFDSGDEGFRTRSNQPFSAVTWDPAFGRVLVRADRMDTRSEHFERDLPRPINPSRDFRLSVRWAVRHQGNAQLAFPLFVGAGEVEHLQVGVASAGILYSSADFNLGTSPLYYFFFDDGVKQHHLGRITLPTSTAYQFVIDYRAATRRLAFLVLGPSGIVVEAASSVVAAGTNAFRFTKIGVASNGKGAGDGGPPDPERCILDDSYNCIPEVATEAWADDIGVSFP